MKKWQCQVCGYIHEGDEPPDQCPVCGADKSLFQLISDTAEEKSKPAERAKAETGGAKKSRCTVCGYVEEGSPPVHCPVCGAIGTLFEPFAEEVKADTGSTAKEEKKTGSAPVIKDPRKVDLGPAPASGKERYLHIAMQQILNHHAHPVSVHIPNGVLPISFVFLILSAISGSDALRIAACCNMIFVVLSMPLVLFTGYVEWKNRYKGFLSKRFLTKILCAAIVAATSLLVAVWLLVEPDVLSAESGHRFMFLITNLIMLGGAGAAGFIGGKLVFRD